MCPLRKIVEESSEVARLIPQECFELRTVKAIVVVPVLEIELQIVDVVEVLAPERASERDAVQIKEHAS